MKTYSIAALVLLATAGVAQAQSWVVSGGFDYTTGDYGTGDDTEILTLPFSARYEVDRWTYKLTVPFVRISGPSDVVSGVGPVGRPGGRGNDTASGMGDPVFAATYATLIDPERPMLDLTGKLKLGIADEDIGTGEHDVMFQADVYQSFGAWTPFGTLGYRFLGDPSGVNLKNGFYLAAGTSYRLDEVTSVGGVFDWRQRTVSGSDNAFELTGFVTRQVNDQWKVQAYLLKGFTDGSPDYGLGANASYAF